jgi:hypothetical protein
MDVTVSVVGRDAVAVEELRFLFTWLGEEEEFRGRVRLVEAAPEPGALGGWPEAVTVALGEGGAVTVLASAVISWIRHRTSDVTCTMTRRDGTSVKLEATRVRGTDLAELGELVDQVVAALGDAEGSRDGGSTE